MSDVPNNKKAARLLYVQHVWTLQDPTADHSFPIIPHLRAPGSGRVAAADVPATLLYYHFDGMTLVIYHCAYVVFVLL
jgi:hypothetical protein